MSRPGITSEDEPSKRQTYLKAFACTVLILGLVGTVIGGIMWATRSGISVLAPVKTNNTSSATIVTKDPAPRFSHEMSRTLHSLSSSSHNSKVKKILFVAGLCLLGCIVIAAIAVSVWFVLGLGKQPDFATASSVNSKDDDAAGTGMDAAPALSKGQINGIVLGSTVLLAIILFIVFIRIRYSRERTYKFMAEADIKGAKYFTLDEHPDGYTVEGPGPSIRSQIGGILDSIGQYLYTFTPAYIIDYIWSHIVYYFGLNKGFEYV
jgi:hypothetical protein